MTEEDAQAVIQSKDNELATNLLGLIRGTLPSISVGKADAPALSVAALTSSQEAAQKIMAANFLGFADVVRHFNARFTEEQLVALADVPFDEAMLRACKDSHILFPGFPITILQLRSRMPRGAFRIYEDAWYNGHDFARKERVRARWYLLRKDAVPNSFGRSYNDQLVLLGKGEEVPMACEVVFGAMLFFAVRETRLFQTYYVRTKSLSGVGRRIVIGGFDSDGLRISDWFDIPSGSVGLASSGSSL
jgi:hypothetical protein